MPFVEWSHESEPSSVSLLARSALTLARQPMRATRLSFELLRSAQGLLRSSGRPRLPLIDRDPGAMLSTSAALRAPKTPFNAPITPHRRFAFCELSLTDIKKVKNAAGHDRQRRGDGAVRRRAAALARRPRRVA